MDSGGLRSWFSPDELRDCPDCGGRALLPAHPGQELEVCLDCGPLVPPTPQFDVPASPPVLP